ncbi:MAG: NAD(P)-binding protein, partial [Gammaproteobacteria bacterium]|nr:NAD(P)-binding protein [Gammaproteobacteria bacterium]
MQQDKRVMIVIGAGVTGITAAYYFSKKKIPYIILEKSDKVGGVWSAQHWPGIRCDTDIIKYSFSFNPYL